jgi:hypothetical protein
VRREKGANGRCRTFDELVALGEARGYAHPEKWAKFVLAGRARRAARFMLLRNRLRGSPMTYRSD